MSFERGSALSQIDSKSFEECISLHAFCVPPQLEVVEWDLFWYCELLTQLRFEIPSGLKQLELPPSDFGSLCIPDSVEVIGGYLRKGGRRSCVLQFGEESQLKIIELKPFIARLRRSLNVTAGTIGMFLRFSERKMRAFRSKCESS
jgi:hypothetical protein